jgi:hypothetical protein
VDARDKPGHDERLINARFYWLHFESDSEEPLARRLEGWRLALFSHPYIGLLQRRSRLLDFDALRPYIVAMTKLLDEAVAAVRRLPSDDQDDIARAIMQLAGSDLAAPIALSPEQREAIARSKAAAGRGEFATDEQVRAVWAKHGL